MSNNKLFIFGLHAVQALLSSQPDRVKTFFVQKERHDQKIQDLLALAENHNIRVEFVPRLELDRLTRNAVHQGVVAQAEQTGAVTENDLESIVANNPKPLLLILDGVQDPHNLGACLRSADAAGVHAVIVPKDKSVGITPVVSKVACGAAETMPFIQVTNLARTLRELKEQRVWLYGAAGEAQQSLYQTDFASAAGIILGAEGEGLRRLTKEHCDVLLQIPMHGSVSSLNVSVATGVFLFEAVRQRLARPGK